MHHKNNHHSTSNNNNPQHHKPSYPTEPNPGGRYGGGYPTKPVPSSSRKPSVLSRIKDRFKEKPATKEEVEQLGLNAKREVYKTQIVKAKKARPSRFENIFGGGGQSGGGSRRSGGGRRSNNDSGSWVFGGNSSMGNDFFSGGGEKGPSLDMFKYDSGKKSKKSKSDGLTEMF